LGLLLAWIFSAFSSINKRSRTENQKDLACFHISKQLVLYQLKENATQFILSGNTYRSIVFMGFIEDNEDGEQNPDTYDLTDEEYCPNKLHVQSSV
jgi:hypothetical protein